MSWIDAALAVLNLHRDKDAELEQAVRDLESQAKAGTASPDELVTSAIRIADKMGKKLPPINNMRE